MSHVTVTLMKSPGCGGCIATDSTFKTKLKGTGIDIERVDMTQDAEAYALAKDTLGYMAAPVTVVRDSDGTIVDHWGGVKVDKITEWAGKLIEQASVLAHAA